MKVKAIAAAAALVFSVGASADVIDLGDVTLSGGDSFFAMGFVSHAAGETFSDYFLFTLNDPGVTSWRGAANFNTPTLANFSSIQNGLLELYEDNGPLGLDASDDGPFPLAVGNDIAFVSEGLFNRSYYLKYSGTVVGDTPAFYSYALGVEVAQGVRTVTAVPEPETYGMFLAGLGMLGLVARGRRR